MWRKRVTDLVESVEMLMFLCVSVAKEGGNHRTSVLSELFWVL